MKTAEKYVSLPVLFCSVFLLAWVETSSAASVDTWKRLWPRTDFSNSTVPLKDIQSGGPGKDGIPAIDSPAFASASSPLDIAGEEPVIGLIIGNDARAYPLRILMWHEIVNDTVGGVPVTVTYCPLCNTSIVFDRRIQDRVLDFGTTGNLRHSDLVMYDRQTESWWQQYSGEAIVGKLAGTELTIIPSRLESFDNFRRRAPNGKVLVPNDPEARRYGANPYVGYDSSPLPFLYRGRTPKGVAPMMRVVAVGNTAFTLPLVGSKGRIEHEDLLITWNPGQRSALDAARLEQGTDVGNIIVTRDGRDVPYVITFAFAFFAFNPDALLYTTEGSIRR